MKRHIVCELVAGGVALLAALGCATPKKPVERTPWPEATPVTVLPASFDEQAFAAQRLSPAGCEQEARAHLADNREHGWKALWICVKNPSFTAIRRLFEEPWAAEVARRPDGLKLMARVVSNRGGNVEREVALLSEHRVPIFSITMAMSQPRTYKGRLVLMRAKVSEVRARADASTVMLTEYALGTVTTDVVVGPRYRTESTHSSQVSTRSSASGSIHGTIPQGPVKLGGGFKSGTTTTASSTSTSTSSTLDQRFDSESQETGRTALGRLARADPFLKNDRELLILATFEGLRNMDVGGGEPVPTPILTIEAYYEPNPLVVF